MSFRLFFLVSAMFFRIKLLKLSFFLIENSNKKFSSVIFSCRSMTHQRREKKTNRLLFFFFDASIDQKKSVFSFLDFALDEASCFNERRTIRYRRTTGHSRRRARMGSPFAFGRTIRWSNKTLWYNGPSSFRFVVELERNSTFFLLHDNGKASRTSSKSSQRFINEPDGTWRTSESRKSWSTSCFSSRWRNLWTSRNRVSRSSFCFLFRLIFVSVLVTGMVVSQRQWLTKSVRLLRMFSSVEIDSFLYWFFFSSNRFSCVGPCFTANLNIDYVKPLLTPAWVLVRAHVERHEGRKVIVHTTVGNGETDIYAKAVALFIKPKAIIPPNKDQN